jgi:hypothetical protein
MYNDGISHLTSIPELAQELYNHQAHSILETPYGDLTSKYAYISLRDYNKWFDDHPGGLMVLQLRSQTDTIRYVAVAGPYNSSIQDERNDDNIYLPYSIYQEFENSGSIQLKVQVIYELEQATKIVLKPLDNAVYHGDMRELMESAMNEFPLLQKHTQFSVAIESLGGYMIDIWVESVEPAEVVQLGGEVEVEFVESIEEIVEFKPAAAAVAAAVVPSAIDGYDGMSIPEMNLPLKPAPAPAIIPSATEKDAIRAARLARFSSYNKATQ